MGHDKRIILGRFLKHPFIPERLCPVLRKSAAVQGGEIGRFWHRVGHGAVFTMNVRTPQMQLAAVGIRNFTHVTRGFAASRYGCYSVRQNFRSWRGRKRGKMYSATGDFGLVPG